jgi:hypothetical protein
MTLADALQPASSHTERVSGATSPCCARCTTLWWRLTEAVRVHTWLCAYPGPPECMLIAASVALESAGPVFEPLAFPGDSDRSAKRGVEAESSGDVTP